MEDSHKRDTQSSATYSNVVSRDWFVIFLTMAALKDLYILDSDIERDYLTTSFREKVWIQAGNEFGNLEGKYK